MAGQGSEGQQLTQGSFWQLHSKKVFVIGAALSLIGAWTYGELTLETDVVNFLPDIMPQATSFELIDSKPSEGEYLYSAINGSGPIGYVTAGEGQGYSGPIIVLVAWTPGGTITDIQVPQHQETLSWYDRLAKADYFSQYVGRDFSSQFTLGEDIDTATGATRSSRGVAQGVYDGRLLLAEHLGQPFIGPSEQIKLGAAEVILLLGIGLVVLFRMVPGLRRLRWPRYLMLVYGLVFFGVWLSGMLSLINFLVFPIGFAPSPATNPYLYILVFSIIGLALAFGKNFWCFWICPYSALQEGAHFLGGQVRPITKTQLALRKSRYVILWAVAMLVLILRQPQLSVFEPWNTVFSLEGTRLQWLLVATTLGIGLFIYDFWCHFLCPVGATMDIVLKIRAWAVNIYGRLTAR